MRLLFFIALKHLLARKRQSIVSLLGIILGVAFFLAIASLMQGSQKDFIRRLVDNVPHIFITDEYRNPHRQPVQELYTQGAVEIRSVKPQTETRGLRGYPQIVDYLRSIPGVQASPLLSGQGILTFAGKTTAIAMDGMIPADIRNVVTIQNYMKEGSIDDLVTDPDGIVIGEELARIFLLKKGDNITIAASTGQVRVFKILGIFRTGRADYDLHHGFVSLKRMQALLDRPNRANTIIMKIPDPTEARELAAEIEARIGYKTVSWQETSEDIMSTLTIRNIIMYTVVSAVLVVAAFGIYNVISTVVIEKHRDIAILKSMGFTALDVRRIFLVQGVLLGMFGNLVGIPLGCGLMLALMQVRMRTPWSTDMVQIPIDWNWPQFVVAGTFALLAASFAAFLPAKKGAKLKPVDILRGGM